MYLKSYLSETSSKFEVSPKTHLIKISVPKSAMTKLDVLFSKTTSHNDPWYGLFLFFMMIKIINKMMFAVILSLGMVS